MDIIRRKSDIEKILSKMKEEEKNILFEKGNWVFHVTPKGNNFLITVHGNNFGGKEMEDSQDVVNRKQVISFLWVNRKHVNKGIRTSVGIFYFQSISRRLHGKEN